MWERKRDAVYDLACGLTWTAAERRRGEYQVSVTAARTNATCGGDAPAPDTEPSAAVALLARVAGIAVPAATRLLNSYGSLAALRHADADTLCTMHGLSHRQAGLLRDAFDLAATLLMEPQRERPQMRSPHDAARLVMPEMGLLEREQMRLLLLNSKNRLIATVTLYNGTISQCAVRAADVLREALRHNAAAVILVHNHPSNDPTPSPEDIAVTRDLVSAGTLMDIQILDHLVVGRDAYTSLRERGFGWN